MAGPVRYAVVGLGYIAQIAVLPAFRHARNSRLVALVSGDPVKRRRLKRLHDAEVAIDYDDFDRLVGSGDVDAVYVALPNSLHADFTLRALRAGVHVLCEKPLASTVEDAEAMVREARRRRRHLMTAYRLHFERTNLGAVEVVRSGRLGEPRTFASVFSMQVRRGNVRLSRELGGGSVWDLGIYCINAARYLFREEPLEVVAVSQRRAGDARFREVDEMTSAILTFPGRRTATFTSSFGAADEGWYQVVGTKGSLCVDPAYEYAGRLEHWLTIGDTTTHRASARRDQFAPELVHFSDCVREGRPPGPDGEEGLADVRIIEAIYRSAETGAPVKLAPARVRHRPDERQELQRPPVRKPRLVHAEPAHE